MCGKGNVESLFELPDDDSSEFSSRSKGSSKLSHGKAHAVPYVVPIHVPGPVTTGQRASVVNLVKVLVSEGVPVLDC